MRVVSLVPSWTETLLSAGVNVIGRTRYCVHPADQINSIPILGGTKDLDFAKLNSLKPDLLLLDKHENLPWMAEYSNHYISNIDSIHSMPSELKALANILSAPKLLKFAERYQILRPSDARNIRDLPGVLEWIRTPLQEPENILYLIWKNPWMLASRNTFIGSVLEHLGIGDRLHGSENPYPEVDLKAFDPRKTVLLFSTEPYPFATKKAEIFDLGFPSALVDGESFSWFGIRNLNFLESISSE